MRTSADERAPPAGPAGNLDWVDKLVGACSTILGMLPPALTGFGVHWASLYNPQIYEHLEFFLIIPAAVALYASWSIMVNPASMGSIFIAFIVIAFIVLIVYLGFPTNFVVYSINVHSLNWLLSYCAAAMFIALLFGFVLTLRRY